MFRGPVDVVPNSMPARPANKQRGQSAGRTRTWARRKLTKSLKRLAHPARFERATSAFGGQRSIQLSYGCRDISGEHSEPPLAAQLCDTRRNKWRLDLRPSTTDLGTRPYVGWQLSPLLV